MRGQQPLVFIPGPVARCALPDASARRLGRITEAARRDRPRCGEASARKITVKMSPTIQDASAIGV